MVDLEVRLPYPHKAQRSVMREQKRFNVLACGRRWGKTKIMCYFAALPAIDGKIVGYFAADYKRLIQAWSELNNRLGPIIKRSNSTERRIELITGGIIDGWSLEDEDAGKSRAYHRAIIDEAAMVANLLGKWNESIRPTLTDFQGDAWFGSSPKGMNDFYELFSRGQEGGRASWASWQRPTSTNPYIAASEIEDARLDLPEIVFRQEYLAEFVNYSGGVFKGFLECIDGGLKSGDAGDHVTFGIDLARTQDFTVITGVDSSGRQVYFERFNQVSWERAIEAAARAVEKYPGSKVLVDATGVGDPVYEILKKRLPHAKVEAFKFTSQSKEALIENLAIKLESRELRLLDNHVQTAELAAFEYQTTAGGRTVRMNAPTGKHDDCVVALGLAVWGLRNPRRELRMFIA